MDKKIKCVEDKDGFIIPLSAIMLIERREKRIYVGENNSYMRWHDLSNEQYNALMGEIEIIGGKFID